MSERAVADDGTAPGGRAAVESGRAAGGRAPGIRSRLGRHRWWRLPALIALIVVVYLLVVALYASSGRVTSTGEKPDPRPGEVAVNLTVQSVNASAQTISMEVAINPSTELEDPESGLLANTLTLIVFPSAGNQTLDFAKDSLPGSTQNITLTAPGEIENWPFDQYEAGLVVVAYTTVDGVRQEVPSSVTLGGSVPGWTISNRITYRADTTISNDQGAKEVPIYLLTASRSSSTLAFGIVLLGLMTAMPVLVLIVAITAYRGRRKVEATLTSWMGAMLFATIPLRTFLPGSPPIGSWIDYLIVLWVIVGLITGLAIYVAAWLRWGSPQPAVAARERRPLAVREEPTAERKQQAPVEE